MIPRRRCLLLWKQHRHTHERRETPDQLGAFSCSSRLLCYFYCSCVDFSPKMAEATITTTITLHSCVGVSWWPWTNPTLDYNRISSIKSLTKYNDESKNNDDKHRTTRTSYNHSTRRNNQLRCWNNESSSSRRR